MHAGVVTLVYVCVFKCDQIRCVPPYLQVTSVARG